MRESSLCIIDRNLSVKYIESYYIKCSVENFRRK